MEITFWDHAVWSWQDGQDASRKTRYGPPTRRRSIMHHLLTADASVFTE